MVELDVYKNVGDREIIRFILNNGGLLMNQLS